MSDLALLLFLSAFLFNPPIQFGLGIREAFLEREEGMSGCVVRATFVFFSALVLWHVSVFVLYPLTLGFLCEFLLFPLSFLSCFLCARLFAFIKKPQEGAKENRAASFEWMISNALFVFLAVFLTFRLALNSLEAAVLNAGFAGGLALSNLIIKAVRLRAAKEKPPQTMRGLPLMLITMALIALIFSAAGRALFTQ